MHWVYVLASYVVFWVLAPILLLHGKTRHGLFQRLGFYRNQDLPSDLRPRVWFHGASAGDLLALSPVIRKLRNRNPNVQVILSTMTNTGYMMAKEKLTKDVDAIVYCPYDLWGATRRAVASLRPTVVVLEYTEIWPNLIDAAHRLGARIVLTNGRFSPKQLGNYRRLFSLIGNPLKKMHLFLMREEEEAERARTLGAPQECMYVTGNTKFDALHKDTVSHEAESRLRSALGVQTQEPMLIAGSTHEGEEARVLEVYKRLLVDHPRLRLVIAPRYVDRSKKVAALTESMGFSVGFRSELRNHSPQVVILDTIGELASAYRLAALVFVGGSFTARGGQNILEPAGQGRPVLFGPNMENFKDSVQVLVGRGGIQVNDTEHFYRVAAELLEKPEKLHELGGMALAAVRQVSGASQRNVELIEKLLHSEQRA